MDIERKIQVETDGVDSDREADNRRRCTEQDWIRDCYAVSEMFDGNENAWDDLGRHERLAQACYE